MSKVVKSGQTKSGKAFQLTLNQVECFDELREYLLGLKSLNYVIACKEVAPTTGHVHIHVYVQFMDSVKMSITKLCGAHVEKCRGSAQQNIAYIKKDGDVIYEHGEPRFKGGHTIKEVENMSSEARKQLPIQMFNIVRKVEEIEKKYISPLEYYKQVEVFYVYGDSGAGKTKWCIDDMVKNKLEKFNEVKYDGSFWHGVTEDCAVCLYDDWRDSHMKPAEFINFIDYNRHVMNVKGGSMRNNYTRIYISSVQPPENIYKSVNGEPRKQWERRMKIIYIDGLGNWV